MVYDDPDIICLSETHLSRFEYIPLDGYKYFGNSRPVYKGRKSGGVAILVKNDLFTDYSIVPCSTSFEGILGIELIHRHTDFCAVIVCNYLPPATSDYGKDPESFFGRLLQLSYEFCNACFMCYCGDFNARIGLHLDNNSEVLPERLVIDTITNGHGKSMLDFLNDSNCCVLNGRYGGVSDTCHVYNGSSMVDYAVVPVEHLDAVQRFVTVALDDLVHELGIEYMITDRSSLPDHDMLQFKFASSGLFFQHLETRCGDVNQKKSPRVKTPRKFKQEYMNNARIRSALIRCVERLQSSISDQSAVDECYDQLSKEILWEMDKFKKLSKRCGTPYKEFWNSNLSALWRDIQHCYKNAKELLKGVNKKKLKRLTKIHPLVARYLDSQHLFDRALRAAKKKFCLEMIVNMEDLSKIGNPKDFWSAVDKLGPRTSKSIVCEAFDKNGCATRDPGAVFAHWKNCFEGLYGTAPTGDFDENFFETIMKEFDPENISMSSDSVLNSPITLVEVKKVVDSAKSGKATGPDLIPTEALQNVVCIQLLYKLFSHCFNNGVLPSEWSKCNIVPILKGKTSVSTEPLSHRGLAMQSCVFKLYGLLLNNRVSTFLEANDKLHETQKGFCKGRSCADHIFSLSELIKLNMPEASFRVYCCFVDIRKAFPSVNHDLLLWKLHDIGIDGKMFASLCASFNSPVCRLKLPIGETDYFNNSFGTLEGSPNSPMNFAIFINALLQELHDSELGVFYGYGRDERISCLAYADDLVLIASSSEKLQCELNILQKFCSKWRLNVNTEKTKVMIFRHNASCKKTTCDVFYGGLPIEQVAEYKYLGVIFDATSSYKRCMESLGSSSSRALGALLTKIRDVKDIGKFTLMTS